MNKSTPSGKGADENKSANESGKLDSKDENKVVQEPVNLEEIKGLSSDNSSPKISSVGDHNDGTGGTPPSNSNGGFIDEIYQEITSVIGGDNPHQFFCMGLPGTIVETAQYFYSLGSKEPKPAFVAANESKLVNKLFDANRIAVSDNGRHLNTQYKTALDTLTPRLNSKLFEAKTELRKVLMTPYPYTFEDGTHVTGLTLQQVFYKLYSDYVKGKQEWAKMQADKKVEISASYPEKSPDNNRKIRNEYLNWYASTAEPQILHIEEKLGKVLSVFSPGDMSIITGILDSGTGRELAEARATLANVQQLSPNGGYIYPVTLYPENWISLLKPSTNKLDLLESPAALSQKMSVLLAQRNNLTGQISALSAVIPNDTVVKKLKEAYDAAETQYSKTISDLTKTYKDVTIDTLKVLIGLAACSGLAIGSLPVATIAKAFGIKSDAVPNVIDDLVKNTQLCLDAQKKANEAATAATDAAVKYFETHNRVQYETMILPLKKQFETTNEKIKALQEDITLASAMQSANKNISVVPNEIPEGFMQIIISSAMSKIKSASSSSASASESSYGTSFFFGGYSGNQSHKDAINESFTENSDMEIQIGMSVSKVQIDREWFNPGVFALSADMYNYSNIHVSPAKDYIEFNDERFKEMNQCVFPCFPTSFIVAKDMTIKFSSTKAISSAFAQSVEDHSSSGGGFFIFSGSRSSSSSSSQSNSVATSSSKSVTVRFTTPQILGYYLQSTPSDKSLSINASPNVSDDYVSIFDFIKTFQGMLDDYNKTYNKQTLNMQLD